MQASNIPDVNHIHRTYNAKSEHDIILHQKETHKGLDKETLDHFHNSQEYYRELLDGAKPIPPEVLTVPRINSLHKKNTMLVSFLSSLYVKMQLDQENSNEEIRGIVAAYLSEIEDFAAELRKV